MTDFSEVGFDMREKTGTKGSTTVEAAVLFPLVISLTLTGFTIMTHWYSRWEDSLEQHCKESEENNEAGNLRLLHWEQWGTLLEDVYEEDER